MCVNVSLYLIHTYQTSYLYKSVQSRQTKQLCLSFEIVQTVQSVWLWKIRSKICSLLVVNFLMIECHRLCMPFICTFCSFLHILFFFDQHFSDSFWFWAYCRHLLCSFLLYLLLFNLFQISLIFHNEGISLLSRCDLHYCLFCFCNLHQH